MKDVEPISSVFSSVSPALKKAVITGDFRALTEEDRALYVKMQCDRLGLDFLGGPIQWLPLKNKRGEPERLVPYFAKNYTDQIREIYKLSVEMVSAGFDPKNETYGVVMKGTLPSGRSDTAIGVVPVVNPYNGNPLTGEHLANAQMKAWTKAHRRLTLQMCSAGIMDELEAESISEELEVKNLKKEAVTLPNGQKALLPPDFDGKPVKAPSSDESTIQSDSSPHGSIAESETLGGGKPTPNEIMEVINFGKSKGLSVEQIKEMVKSKLGKESSKDLTYGDLEVLMDLITLGSQNEEVEV